MKGGRYAMKGRAVRTLVAIGLLILSIALAARGAALVSAAPLPTTATPKSAHFDLEVKASAADPTTGETFEIMASGQGDIDNVRQAMQLSYDMELPDDLAGSGLPSNTFTIAMVMVDERLYMLDPTTQQWMWFEMPAGSTTTQIAPDVSDWSDIFGADFEFTQVGPEEVNGAATTRWHMDFDFGKLLNDPDLMPDPSASPLPPMIMTFDLWIGDADNYLHRMAMGMDFALPEEEGLDGGFSMSMSMVMTYSKFDQPVKIVAPAGATPIAEGDTPTFATGLFPGLSALPLDGSAFGLPGSGTISGITNSPAASPTPRPNLSGIVIATAEPTATPKATSTPTPAATATPTAPPPTAPPPTATVAIVANASIPPTAVVQAPAAAAATTAQQPQAAPATRSSLPVVLGAVALAALLVLSGGLIVAGRRMGQR